MNTKIKILSEKLGDSKLIIASSTEPYVHFYHGGEIKWRSNAGGVATAFDFLMKNYGGTWVSVGLGTADKDVVNSNGKIMVPPGKEQYTLKRVFISKKEEDGFLALSSNSALWPLSHVAYVTPKFSADAWEQYKIVNKAIANSIGQEVIDRNTIVWINDYHLSLCAKYLKETSPEISTAFFWHIPWPSLETFKIFPWKEEILEALLYNDVIGFHIPLYAKNFLYSAEKTLGCKVDWMGGEVDYAGRKTIVKALPIGIDGVSLANVATSLNETEIMQLRREYNVFDRKLILGVDRMDYTKGIPNKIKAIDLMLMRRPDLAGKVSLLQIAAPTRTTIPEYANVLEETTELVDSINWKYAVGNWQPIVFLNQFISLDDIVPLYKAADVCLVTSLQDGMNLVSKEYIASNPGNGVLVLSKFAGSAEELTEAVQVNPFFTEEIARGIEQALEMSFEEKKNRMTSLKQRVFENNVFKWASDFIEIVVNMKVDPN